jgi:ubiquinone/menaquinone biosynthesis C-methylase UbiE
MAEVEWTEEMSRLYAAYMKRNVKHDHRRWAEWIARDWPEAPAGATVADVAGGPAYLLLELAPRLKSPRLVLTDSSPVMVKLAGEQGERLGLAIETHLCPAEKLDLPDASVDLVTCKHALRFAPDQDAVLRELARVTKPGGRAYCIDFNPDGPRLGSLLLLSWIKLTAPRFIAANFGPSMRMGPSPDALLARFRAAGFRAADLLHPGVSYLIRAVR